jgi:hypothetical protein
MATKRTAVQEVVKMAEEVDSPRRWLVAAFRPTALFSLKLPQATSGVGKTVIVPMPYTVKMGLVDAAARRGVSDIESLVIGLRGADVRIGVPPRAVVTHTIVKIRQERKERTPDQPYSSAVAYREFVAMAGDLQCAFDLSTLPESQAGVLLDLLPQISYFGKRGGFVQYLGRQFAPALNAHFTQPLDRMQRIPVYAHLAMFDDFGPKITWEVLNSYSDKSMKRGDHRKAVLTMVPLGIVSAGPGFTEYASAVTTESA